MDKELLKDILSTPSCTGKEERVREFLIAWAIANKIPVRIDTKGNVYLKKGVLDDGESYPCVVAHMDTVHEDQKNMVDKNEPLIIMDGKDGDGRDIYYAMKPSPIDGETNNVRTGCGGDDKAGLFIALQIMEQFDKIVGAFFVEEETGCWGSREASVEWLSDVGYFIQFDAPTDNWVSKVCSGVLLFNQEFHDRMVPIWEEFEQTNISTRDPFTDVMALKKKFPVCCVNYFAGYMNMHSKYEYVVLDYVEKAINLGVATINELGCNRYEFQPTNI